MRTWILVALVACGNTPATVTGHTDASQPASQPAAGPAVVLNGARVQVSLARTEAERERGLMYVNYLPVDDGMLFIFDDEQLLTFWMKNTLIPLDMIFIHTDLTVAGVVANAKPLSLDTRGVNEPSRYVLEVNGGWAAAHGVTSGTKVRFENIP